ncbi:hypothetical protein [Okeania sp. KiyG1]|uniref:hypothetical protein n=1 Tax=Okeania sp. KiyG1 TaxID=2720165 RepID=UPI0019224B7F|nr:hypothetical protein [Okeania sp. KiyG1]GFZ98806.1 hypothetical protein CYANOKiyG1_10240 [Okeania sp. KiyG1]
MSSEAQAQVIANGSSLINTDFAGDDAPCPVFPNVVGEPNSDDSKIPTISSVSPVLSINQLDDLFDFANLDRSVELASQLAVQHPKSLYLFMQRYTHFNGYAGSLVARLASSIGLSRHLFNSSSNPVVDEADRGLEIAAKVFAATIDEHSDRGAKFVPHRTLAQATLRAVGDYASLTVDERNTFSMLPDWMLEILDKTVQGYQGVPGNVIELIRAIGFHAASEVLAHREYSIIDKVVRHDNRNLGFDAYLRQINGKVEVEQGQFSPWYWIVIHGKHQGVGVEAEHFQLALEALDLVAKYRTESDREIQKLALQGFSEFVAIQQKLFQEISQECSELLISNPVKQL